MPSIDVVDSITINAEPSAVFDVVSDYSNISAWFPVYRCELKGASEVREGVLVEHTYGHPPFVLSEFTRKVDRIIPSSRLEESYVDGDLRGTGVWRFNKVGDCTEASYHCKVSANTVFTKIMFSLIGTKAHSNTYKKLLSALKVYCEKNS